MNTIKKFLPGNFAQLALGVSVALFTWEAWLQRNAAIVGLAAIICSCTGVLLAEIRREQNR